MEYNIEAFNRLINDYEAITARHIRKAYNYAKANTIAKDNNPLFIKFITNADVLAKLTNFGTGGCILCISAYRLSIKNNFNKHKCNYCLHNYCLHNIVYEYPPVLLPCEQHSSSKNMYSYYKNSTVLLKLIKERVDFLKSVIFQYEEKLKDM